MTKIKRNDNSVFQGNNAVEKVVMYNGNVYEKKLFSKVEIWEKLINSIGLSHAKKISNEQFIVICNFLNDGWDICPSLCAIKEDKNSKHYTSNPSCCWFKCLGLNTLSYNIFEYSACVNYNDGYVALYENQIGLINTVSCNALVGKFTSYYDMCKLVGDLHSFLPLKLNVNKILNGELLVDNKYMDDNVDNVDLGEEGIDYPLYDYLFNLSSEIQKLETNLVFDNEIFTFDYDKVIEK